MTNENLTELDRLMVEDVIVDMMTQGKSLRVYKLKQLAKLVGIPISEADEDRLDMMGDREWKSMRPVYRHHVAMFVVQLFGFELDDLPMLQTAEVVDE